jgi:hypothetical protein
MRKLVVTTLMSLDGVVAAPERLLPMWDDEAKRYAVTELADFDAFLLGRVTYEAFAARWPMVRGDTFADALNRLPKYIASRTLRDATWNGSTVLRGNVADAIGELKREPGKQHHEVRAGSAGRDAAGKRPDRRDQDLPHADRDRRTPAHLEGIDQRLHPALRLTNTQSFRNGLIRLTYEVKGNNQCQASRSSR